MKKSCYIAVMATMMAFTTQAEAREFNPFTGQYEPSESNSFSDNVKEGEAFQPYIGVGVGIFAIGYQEPGLSQRNPTWGSFIKAGVDVSENIGFELQIGTTGEPSTDWSTLYPGLKLATKINYYSSYLLKLGTPIGESNHIHLYGGATTANYTATLSAPGLPSKQIGSTKTGFTYGLGYDSKVSDTMSFGIDWMEYWTNVTFDNTGGAASQGSFRSLSANLKMSY